MTDDNDHWELRWVHRPEGTHRSKSRQTPGADRELLREDGTNRLIGPAESRPVDEEDLMGSLGYGDEPSSEQARSSPFGDAFREEFGSQAGQFFAQVLADVLVIVVREVLVPAVDEHLIPALRRRVQTAALRFRAAIQRRRAAIDEIDEITVIATAPATGAIGQDPGRDEPAQVTMTFAEFRTRFQTLVEAEEFVQRMRDGLAADAPPEMRLSAEEDDVARRLQKDLAALDDQGVGQLLDWLGGQHGPGGQYRLALPAARPLELPRPTAGVDGEN